MPANTPAHHSQWGAKIGPRIAKLVSDAIIYTHMKLIGTKHKLAMMAFNAMSDEISHEVDITLGPLFAKLHDGMEESHPSYPMVHFLHTMSGQLKALAGAGLQVSGILGSVAAIMNNELASVVYSIVAAQPGQLPDVGTIVQAYAANQVTQAEAMHGLAALGIQTGWAERMLELGRTWPDPATSAELFRRNLISHDQFVTYLQMNGVPSGLVDEFIALWENPVSPADLALAVLRGNMTLDQAVALAHESGVTEDTLNILIENTGEPPGTEQLLEAYRRGFIDEDTLKKGILQSRVRDEWIPTLEQLRYSPISVADAVNAVVQDQLSMADGEKYAEYNGLEPGGFQILYDTAGEPLSRTEMEELYNRGLVDENAVIQGLRESRLKNKYNDLAFALHQKILPIYTMQHALRYGGISESAAIAQAMANGYSKDDAQVIVNSGSAERLQTYKDKVVAAVMSMYEDNTISEADASSVVTGMGYSADDASFILKSSEFHRQTKIINAAVNAIKSKYLGHHITENEAVGLVDAMGIPSQQRDELMSIWNIEHNAYTKTLTEAQIVKAVNDALITPEDGQSRLEALGYSSGDATLLIEGA